MLSRYPRIRLLLILTLPLFAMLLLARVGFYFYFLDGTLEHPKEVIEQAWWIGIRFDFRLALTLALPVVILTLIPRLLSPRYLFGKSLALIWLALASSFVIFTYISDFAHYGYLDERINVSVMRFLEDGEDSLLMVWQTYPVITLVLILLAVTAAIIFWSAKALRQFAANAQAKQSIGSVALGIAVFVLCVIGWMGKATSTVPLRWSDAFFSGDMRVAALGLNPVLFFLDTYSNQSRTYDKDKVAEYFPLVSEFLGLDANNEIGDFSRTIPANPKFDRPPNVVLIHVESMGANRLGILGNETGATPVIDQLAEEGIFFPNFMVPSSGTARTVFGLVTGIPDVVWGGSTASRDPLIVDQYTLVNAFEGYQRLYFIGGSAGWANIKGVLETNIDDLELWEEGDWTSPEVDVWGISDYSLFRESHQRLEQLDPDQPFIAFIQTAGNHRPFTIPNEGSGFEVTAPDESWIKENGFLGLDQYNAVRLLDFNIGYYLNELVSSSHYADNTIFVFYGDHNDRSNPSKHMGYSEKLFLDKHHVPMIIYAPGLVDAKQHLAPVSLVDILPTVLGLIGLPYENRTMGRDVLNLTEQQQAFALTFGGDRGTRPLIGLLGSDFHTRMYYDGGDPKLLPLENASLENDQREQYPGLAKERIDLLHGIYESARFMLHHNNRNKSDIIQ